MVEKPTYEELEIRVKELEKISDVPKQAEEELLLRSEIMTNMVEGVYLIRVDDGIIVYTNPKFEKMFGYGPDEMLGKNVSIVNAPILKAPEETVEEIMRVLRKKGEWHGEVHNIKKDGTPFWCYANVSTFHHSKHGEVLVSVHEDISERKQAEEALRQSENLFTSQFELGNIGMALTAPDKRWVKINKRLCQMLGYSKEELVKMNWAEVTYPEDLQKDVAQFERVLAGEIDGYELDKRFMRKDGEIIFVHLTVGCIRNSDNSVKYLIASLLDISDRIQAEESLRESEARYNDLYDNAPDMYVSVAAGTALIRQCNQTLASKLGYKKEEIVGRPIFDMYHPDCMDKVKEAFRSFVETGEVHDTELQIKRKDGSKFDVSLNVSAFRDKDGKIQYSRSSWRDITERKQAEEALLREKEKLQDALAKIKTLSGMLPICASCKKIRDDKGYWNQIEGYIERHSDASFSHGLCPECMDKIYGDEDWYQKLDGDE